MPRPPNPARELERKIYEILVDFPERLDEMETRNEENCRVLSARIARLLEEEVRRRIEARDG